MTTLSIFVFLLVGGLVAALFPHKAIRPLGMGVSLIAGTILVIFQFVLEVKGFGVFFYPIATVLVAVALFFELKNSKASKGVEEAQQQVLAERDALKAEVEGLKLEKQSLSEKAAEYAVLQKLLGDDPLKRIEELLKK